MAKRVQDFPNQFGVALTYVDDSVEIFEFVWFEAAVAMVLEVEEIQRSGDDSPIDIEVFNLQTGLIIEIERGVAGVPVKTIFPCEGGDYITKWIGSGVDESLSFQRVA